MLTYGGIIWIYIDKLGDMDSAYVWTEKMLSFDPENAWGHFYLGSIYIGLDSLKKAEEALMKTRDLNVYLFMGQYRLAHIYRIQGRHQDAIDVLERIVSINPAETSANYDMGINYKALGKNIQANQQISKFLKPIEKEYKENKDDAVTCIAMAISYSRLGNKAKAWKFHQNAMEIDSTLYLRYAEFYALEDKSHEALDQLQLALKNGYRDLVWLKLNPDLQSLHKEKQYNEMLEQYFNK